MAFSTSNPEHRRAAAKPAACPKRLMLSTTGRRDRVREGVQVGKDVVREKGTDIVREGRTKGGSKERRTAGR